jgi:predicted Zn-dependent peptidase
MPMNPETSKLANGLTIVCDPIPGSNSAAVALCLRNGVRHQLGEENGFAHLMEHLLFSGTRNRSADDLAACLAAMGGEVNAVTGRELTSLTGVVPAGEVYGLVRLFAEMFTASAFTSADIERERQVILEEMEHHGTADEELLEEILVCEAWRDHPIARPILGDRSVIQTVSARAMRDYVDRNIAGGRLWLLAVGAVDHGELAEAAQALSTLPAGDAIQGRPPTFHAGERRLGEGGDLVRLVWALPVPGIGDRLERSIELARWVLAGHGHSRLYRLLRDELGASYGIQSRVVQYSDCGLLWIQTQCRASNAKRCRDAVEREIADGLRYGLREDEIALAKQSLRSKMIVEQDRVEARLERLARDVIYVGAPRSQEAQSERYARVTREEMLRAIDSIWPDRLVIVSAA